MPLVKIETKEKYCCTCNKFSPFMDKVPPGAYQLVHCMESVGSCRKLCHKVSAVSCGCKEHEFKNFNSQRHLLDKTTA